MKKTIALIQYYFPCRILSTGEFLLTAVRYITKIDGFPYLPRRSAPKLDNTNTTAIMMVA